MVDSHRVGEHLELFILMFLFCKLQKTLYFIVFLIYISVPAWD